MRDSRGFPRVHGGQRVWLEQRVQLSRGQWRREEAGGAIRSAGWWEAVTVTWSPVAVPGQRPRAWHRVLAAAADAVAPAVAEFVAVSARQLLDRQRGPRGAVHPLRRQLPRAARALPRAARALPRPAKLP